MYIHVVIKIAMSYIRISCRVDETPNFVLTILSDCGMVPSPNVTHIKKFNTE